MNVVKGSVVRALAGRDQDSFFVAVAVEDRWVYIANGKERKLEAPKRKNRKHISPTGRVFDLTDMTDKKLRKLIAGLKTQGSGEDYPDQD